ncbi:hypothetical protein CC80DRAFT_511467 [Byssothecium circinans]|uniref:Uncharacterized protein n=1 Tax=Byssothecium circinans TaxID=147558 RepID=A0A6A5T8V8_9PLEO|nr:hypothetical protein CC80DRAFT_511544 [Byssothecium circinans]KAF1948291.1 hypothetical protein CC80DRAFT_511467 [Byssothecium circinans]
MQLTIEYQRQLRMWIHKDHFLASPPSDAPDSTKHHLGHCIENLRATIIRLKVRFNQPWYRVTVASDAAAAGHAECVKIPYCTWVLSLDKLAAPQERVCRSASSLLPTPQPDDGSCTQTAQQACTSSTTNAQKVEARINTTRPRR